MESEDRKHQTRTARSLSDHVLGATPTCSTPLTSRPEFLGKTDDLLGKTDDVLGKTDDSLGKTDDFLGKTDDLLGKTDDSPHYLAGRSRLGTRRTPSHTRRHDKDA